MAEFTVFDHRAPIAESTIAAFAGSVPDDVLSLWRSYGVGVIGDGFVRTVDPATASEALRAIAGLSEKAVPIFTTGLGDVIIFAAPTFHIIKFRWGVVEFLAGDDVGALMEKLQDDNFLDSVLERAPFPEGTASLGIPDVDECLFFAPLLALGGPNSAEHLHRGGLWEHLELLVRMAGVPRPHQAE